jgi:hypothetical protein
MIKAVFTAFNCSVCLLRLRCLLPAQVLAKIESADSVMALDEILDAVDSDICTMHGGTW